MNAPCSAHIAHSVRLVALWSLMLCAWGVLLRAQVPFAMDKFHLTSQYSIEVWTTANGLPNNSVQDLTQTPDGYLWFGTFNGFVRFDGTRFRQFTTSNTPQMKSKAVESMTVDARGRLWLTLQSAGVMKVDEHSFSFYGAEQGLKSSVIWSVYPDNPDKSLLITTDNGIYRLREDGGKTVIRYDSLLNQGITESPELILLDKAHNCWTGTISKGVFCRTSNGLQHFTMASGLPENNIKGLYEDPADGTIWIGTSKGLCAWREGRLLTAEELGLPEIDSPIWTFLRDRDGYLWFGSNQGLYRWESQSASSSTPKGILQRLTLAEGLSDNSVRALMQDTEGNIWAGTYFGGVNKLKRSRVTVTGTPEGLVNDIVYSVRTTRDSSLLVATVGGFHRFRAGNLRTITPQNGLAADVVRCALEDRQGAVWIATMRGLQKIEPSAANGVGKGTGMSTVKLFDTHNGLVGDQIRILLAAKDGTLWIGTTRGLNGYRNGKFTTFTTEEGLSFRGIVSLYEDSGGALWIGTGGGGVNVLEKGVITKKYHRAEGLATDVAFAFYDDLRPDGSHDIWIGGNGCLSRLRNGVITSLTVKNGLPDDDVFSIIEDKQGRFWMGCNIGILCVSKAHLNECADGKHPITDYTLYDRTDGMRTNNPTVPGSGCVLPDGRFAFPTIKGVVIIDPNSIRKDTIPPKVQVQELIADTLHFTSLRQTLQAMPQAGQSLSDQISEGQVLTLPAGKTNIEIRYTAFCFYAPEKVRFKYRLEGVDETWIDAGNRREVFYTNLAPREYSFRVLACNSDGVWNELGASLRFRIEPFWYQTIWFRVLCVLVAVAALLLLYRFRTWRLRARARVLEETVQQRTRELQLSNAETQRSNARLQEQKEQLEQGNIELTIANDEILRQQHILEGQAADIELANSQLNENNLKLQNLNHEKNEFLGIAAHDLKNPLTAMQMTASLVLKYQEKMSREDLRERLESIIISATRMSQIITNLLDINAIESGKMNLHPVDFDIVPLVRQTVHDYADRAAAKDITLIVENSASEALYVYADASAASQILDNLVSNAIKYSPQGKRVFVRVGHSSLGIGHSSDDNIPHPTNQVTTVPMTNNQFTDGYVRIEVQDEGPGLSEDDKSKLFGKFARLSARPTGGEHSTGLGLSIVKRLAEAMNGNVHCESTLGEGSAFILELPESDVPQSDVQQ